MKLPRIEWIDSPERLDTALADLSGARVAGIDTEFVRTRTFFAQLGLIQLFDGACCRLIDPLCFDDWTPLKHWLADPAVVKVIHSGSEDIEILYRYTDLPLQGFFDTQIAAALVGLGPSLSYQALVSELIGVDLPKGETRSNWLRRPLSQAQLTYATHDVEHLIEIHALLSERLARLGRSEWAVEDCARAAQPPPTEERILRRQFQRLKFAWKLGPAERAVAYALVAWRERTARRIDRPRNWLLDDDAINAIATSQPDSLAALSQCADIAPRTLERNGKRLVALVRHARTEKPPPAPKPPLERSQRPVLNRLKSRVRRKADELRLAPEVLCGRRQLVYLVQHRRLPKSLCGWRRGVIGDELLAALAQDKSAPDQEVCVP